MNLISIINMSSLEAEMKHKFSKVGFSVRDINDTLLVVRVFDIFNDEIRTFELRDFHSDYDKMAMDLDLPSSTLLDFYDNSMKIFGSNYSKSNALKIRNYIDVKLNPRKMSFDPWGDLYPF